MRARTLLWLVPLWGAGFGCNRDELDELDLDRDRVAPGGHGTVAEDEIRDEDLEALKRGDRETFLAEVREDLDALAQWATTFAQDIDVGPKRATPLERELFEDFQRDLGTVERNADRVARLEGDRFEEAARRLHDQVEGLEARMRRITELRRERLAPRGS